MKRVKWFYIIYDLCILVSILLILFSVNYKKLFHNKEIEYTSNEAGEIDYRVNLIDNNIYSTQYLDEGNNYVSDMIKNIDINFKYQFNSDKDTSLSYTYRIDVIIDASYKNANNKKEPFYRKTYNLLSDTSVSESNILDINKKVNFDFTKYNELMNELSKDYKLDSDIKAKIVMFVSIYGNIKDKKISRNIEEYIEMPLQKKIFSIKESIPHEGKKQYYKYQDEDLFDIYYLACGTIALIISLCMIIYLNYLVKNNKEKITSLKGTYANKVSEILKDYGDTIVELEEFKVSNIKDALLVKDFKELLDVANKSGGPIHFYENKKYKRCYLWLTYNNITYKYVVKSKEINNKIKKKDNN